MAISITFTSNALQTSGTTLYVNHANGQIEIAGGPQALQQWCLDNAPTEQQVLAMAIINRFANDPLLDSEETVWNGKTFTLDCEQTSPSNIAKVTG
jgi:hypothetical protein